MLLGLGVQAGTSFLPQTTPELLVRLLGFVAGGILVYGGTIVARAKGYVPYVAFITLLSFLGVGFLLMMPEAPAKKRLFRLLASRKPESGDAPA